MGGLRGGRDEGRRKSHHVDTRRLRHRRTVDGREWGRGRSLTTCSPGDQRWRQLYTDATGLVLELRGGFDGAAMVLESVPAADGQRAARHRIRWSRETDGSVRQHWQMSKDGGVTWIEIFDGRYRRKPA